MKYVFTDEQPKQTMPLKGVFESSRGAQMNYDIDKGLVSLQCDRYCYSSGSLGELIEFLQSVKEYLENNK